MPDRLIELDISNLLLTVIIDITEHLSSVCARILHIYIYIYHTSCILKYMMLIKYLSFIDLHCQVTFLSLVSLDKLYD